MTNDAGHFIMRAALDFIPTHVRVLASENLSATEEVKITEPKGVSLISDVDDTIKHSSIGSGAREIFRNTFIRDLGDLTIDGVKEWYKTMYDMGVGVHYVSNSPWQLFPVLVTFFRMAGLPPGSYHLKQYSGMLQGIFEPVAERKKGTLEKILKDFPQRRFLLIGDSGEADLEVYTDVVLANPGRIIGVFIRDVTTPANKQGFFDSSMGPLSGDRRIGGKFPSRGRSGDSMSSRISPKPNSPEKRPPLPARTVTEVTPQRSDGPSMGKLIDFDESAEETPSVHESHRRVMPRSTSDFERRRSTSDQDLLRGPPLRPSKPLTLRGSTTDSRSSEKPNSLKAAPSPPPKPRRLSSQNDSASPSHPLSQTQSTSELPPAASQGYMSSAREKVSSAYNAMPPAASYLHGTSKNPPGPPPPRQRSDPTTETSSNTAPPPPPRRGVAATAAGYVPKRLSWNSTRSTDTSDDESYNPAPQVPVNKKLDLWKRRWKRAKDILASQGVELRSWRVGNDVCLEAVQLIEKHMRDMGVEGYVGADGRGKGKGKTGEGGGEMKVKDIKSERRS